LLFKGNFEEYTQEMKLVQAWFLFPNIKVCRFSSSFVPSSVYNLDEFRHEFKFKHLQPAYFRMLLETPDTLHKSQQIWMVWEELQRFKTHVGDPWMLGWKYADKQAVVYSMAQYRE